ncbi:hypothetical protein MJO28_004511 [Puccinia striiformis f. sp. tritici]|uniref:Uncharacterized protein n=1 Tax=Puccinia striiformis f. sp. tritici TaxID=168172 RepID=A0ACC0EPN4_9BASI|nr:hypothetical protein MJO28_004511 [Puccinia striiformis f. sp. tritici]
MLQSPEETVTLYVRPSLPGGLSRHWLYQVCTRQYQLVLRDARKFGTVLHELAEDSSAQLKVLSSLPQTCAHLKRVSVDGEPASVTQIIGLPDISQHRVYPNELK